MARASACARRWAGSISSAREEFDAVKAMAAKAREECEALKARLEALEKSGETPRRRRARSKRKNSGSFLLLALSRERPYPLHQCREPRQNNAIRWSGAS